MTYLPAPSPNINLERSYCLLAAAGGKERRHPGTTVRVGGVQRGAWAAGRNIWCTGRMISVVGGNYWN